MIVLNNSTFVGSILNSALNFQFNQLKEKYNEQQILAYFLLNLNKSLTGIQSIIKSSFGLFTSFLKMRAFKTKEEVKSLLDCIFQMIFIDQNSQIKEKGTIII